MKNPWEDIELSDYENHMNYKSVQQLTALNDMMKGQIESYDTDTLMILGIAGGNGLNHIDPHKYTRVYGVDVNENYLIECTKRYPELRGVFETVHADLKDPEAVLPKAEMVMADLVIEYVGCDDFKKALEKIAPKIVSCVIQINTDEDYISDSPYVHTFNCLDQVHEQMSVTGMNDTLAELGYVPVYQEEMNLLNGKKLIRLDYNC